MKDLETVKLPSSTFLYRLITLILISAIVFSKDKALLSRISARQLIHLIAMNATGFSRAKALLSNISARQLTIFSIKMSAIICLALEMLGVGLSVKSTHIRTNKYKIIKQRCKSMSGGRFCSWQWGLREWNGKEAVLQAIIKTNVARILEYKDLVEKRTLAIKNSRTVQKL